MNTNSGQTSRLVSYFKANPHLETDAFQLAIIAGGNGHPVLSLSRRIFESRKALEAQGSVIKTKDCRSRTGRVTGYSFMPKEGQ